MAEEMVMIVGESQELIAAVRLFDRVVRIAQQVMKSLCDSAIQKDRSIERLEEKLAQKDEKME